MNAEFEPFALVSASAPAARAFHSKYYLSLNSQFMGDGLYDVEPPLFDLVGIFFEFLDPARKESDPITKLLA